MEVSSQENVALTDLPPVLILEVFKHLDARDLSVVSCVCQLFRALVSDSNGWKDLYCERWGAPAVQVPAAKEWKQLYVAREGCKSLLGKFRLDRLCGHRDMVRSVRMLPSRNLVVSAGYDTTVRLWDLAEALPVACSHPLDATVRAVAIDDEMLAAGTYSEIKVWHATSACSYLFDLAGGYGCRPTVLRGHSGPVTCLGLEAGGLFSGSWDMSVKLWNRHKLKNTVSFSHCDWVHALVARGGKVLSTAGSDAHSWDVETGSLVRWWRRVHTGNATAVEGNRRGRFVITGGEDGIVRVFDDRVPSHSDADGSSSNEAIAAWIPHAQKITSLAFDDPWLVSASSSGTLALMDLRHVLRKGSSKSSSAAQFPGRNVSVVEGNTVQRTLSGGGAGAYSVDIGADRIVSGGADTSIRIWDFSQAQEIEKRVQASRNLRKEQRMQRRTRTVARKRA